MRSRLSNRRWLTGCFYIVLLLVTALRPWSLFFRTTDELGRLLDIVVSEELRYVYKHLYSWKHRNPCSNLFLHHVSVNAEKGKVTVNKSPWNLSDVESLNFHIKNGIFTPPVCPRGLLSSLVANGNPRSVAILVPFRGRFSHLASLLLHLHPMLQRQGVRYQIFIINQDDKTRFNRGVLLNVGFIEAAKTFDFDCVIFHDVDLLPENQGNLYSCLQDRLHHLSSSIDVFFYKLPYEDLVGGVLAVSRKQVLAMNGFSNLYFGWGGEDDDFRIRAQTSGISVKHQDPERGRYHMLHHKRERGNKSNRRRFLLLQSAATRMSIDGLNTLKYTLNGRTLKSSYVFINVTLNKSDYMPQPE